MQDSWKNIPQWFAAAFGAVYLSGYLIEFFYYTSIGVIDVENDVFKLKYVQVGTSFLLTTLLIGGLAFFLFIGRGKLLRDSHAANAQPRYMFSRLINTIEIVFFLLSILCAFLFTPTHFYRHGSARFWALAALILSCTFGYSLAIFIIEKQFPEGGEFQSERDRWREYVALTLIGVITLCDLFIFEHVWNVFYDLLTHQGYFYVLFTWSLALLVYRSITRPSKKSGTFVLAAYLGMIGLVAVVLIYLTIWTYAYTVFSFIPQSKGGADYLFSPRLNVQLNVDKSGRQRPSFSNQILIYENQEALFLASIRPGDDACAWRDRETIPQVTELQKSEISAVQIRPLGVAEKNCF